MGWGTALLAGAGGAAKGIESRQRFDQAEELKRQLAAQQAELRTMLAELTDTTKRRGQDLTKEQKDAERKAKGDQVAANLERLWSKDSDTSALGWDRNRVTEAGQQQAGDLGWDRNRIAEDLGYGRLAVTERGQDIGATTTRRGQDIGATTARRGQDIGASTATRGQDISASTAAAGQAGTAQRSRAGNVLDVLKLKAGAEKAGASVFGTPNQKPEDWASEFDRLYNDANAMGGEAARAVSQPPAAAAPPPSPGAPPGAPPARAPLPAPVRPQAAAPTPAAPPAGVQVGATVRLKDGRRVTITAISPDGTFEFK